MIWESGLQPHVVSRMLARALLYPNLDTGIHWTDTMIRCRAASKSAR